PGLPVRHLGFVRREFLHVLLQRARALVFFSLFEGFGIPLLEAFHAGTPVVCSNTTSLPEVGGDAVVCCDPTQPVLMCDALLEVDREGVGAGLVEGGKDRLPLFTWEQSARNLVEACQRVLARSGVVPQPAAAAQGEAPPPAGPVILRLGKALRKRVGKVYHP